MLIITYFDEPIHFSQEILLHVSCIGHQQLLKYRHNEASAWNSNREFCSIRRHHVSYKFGVAENQITSRKLIAILLKSICTVINILAIIIITHNYYENWQPSWVSKPNVSEDIIRLRESPVTPIAVKFHKNPPWFPLQELNAVDKADTHCPLFYLLSIPNKT